MANIVGVRFKTAGKVYYFDPLDFDIRRGSHVIVETARGVEYGTVLVGPKEVPDDEIVQPLKAVIRVATDDDDARETYNRIREHEAYLVCKEKIREHNLEMKLIKAEYTFDNNKLIFYFTADGRVDFRELVKDLAGVFRTRIELRQIGVRDETKLLGGVGICGRDLCCHTFLSGFAPVSIRMAKEQNLSLNPTKISGVCGRLMCCLKNEAETYEYLNSRLPRNGEWVTTPDGLRGEVYGTNVLRQTVKVVIQIDDEKDIRTYPVDELRFRSRGGGKQKHTDAAADTQAADEIPAGGTRTEGLSDHPYGDAADSREPDKKDDGYGSDRSSYHSSSGSSSNKNASGKKKNKGNRAKDYNSGRSSKNSRSDSGRGGKSKQSYNKGKNDKYDKGSKSDRKDTDKRKAGANSGNADNSQNSSPNNRNQNNKRRYSGKKNRNKSSEKKNE